MIRAFGPERQGRWSFSSQQATLRRLDKAFAAFFRRVKSGDTPGYPRLRGVNWFDTVEFPKDGDGCRWDSTPHDPQTRVRVQGVGHVKVKQRRAVIGKVKTVSVKREGKRWYVALTAEQEQPEPLPATGSVVGIDIGTANFLTTSHGEHIANPRRGRRAAGKLEAAQQALARCKRRSNRRRKAVAKVAALYRKVRRQRLDHAHKSALALVRAHDLIAHEDRSINDAGWGVFLTILHAKAESAGREVIAVDPRNTSRTCPPSGRLHCVNCGHRAHADTVGALNVLRAGPARRDARKG
ncbi:RNA-guided endonuclease InsQ/TnpB family protein [Kitasatospora sp. P5_F3]